MSNKTRNGVRQTLMSAGFALGVLLAGPITSANAITIGADAIDRANNDSFSNFAIGLQSTPIPSAHKIDSWKVFTGNTGELALLILNGNAATPTVRGVFQETIAVAGLNMFNLATPFSIQTGDFLGIWMGGAKVDWDNNGGGIGYSTAGLFASAPTVGTAFNLNTSLNRTYSINVNYIPEPGALAILGLGLIGLGMVRRKQAA